jgi:N-acetylglucosamine-6-sulfatase
VDGPADGRVRRRGCRAAEYGVARRVAVIAISLGLAAFALAACEPPGSDEAPSDEAPTDEALSDEAPPPTRVDGELPPNVILVVTDDQTAGSMEGRPVAMPWLQDRLDEPGWTTFTNAIVTTPLCCPSRASILTGRVASHTGVLTNDDGEALDDADTLPVWLHDAGYRTALIGKYLNGYPWDDPPPIPPGWDRWFAKLNASPATVYAGYDVVDDSERRTMGSDPDDYATDRLAREAVTFVASAPADRPFFLYFAPSAPHEPAEPAPRHASLLDQPASAPDASALAAMNDVSGAPGWIRERPPIDAETGAVLADAELRERVALRAVDDAFRGLWEAVDARRELDRTVWIFLSDNGYSFGDRRWIGKTCPWETCIHIPFIVHAPGTRGGSSPALVANIDVAPTIADAVGGLGVMIPMDGRSMVTPATTRSRILLEWFSASGGLGWASIRTATSHYIEYYDMVDNQSIRFREYYDLTSDPWEMNNLLGDASSANDPNTAALSAQIAADRDCAGANCP